MPAQKVAKITISLPRDLADIVDRIAEERSTSRSSVIADLLEKQVEANIEALMEEGYREMAEENLEIARNMSTLADETLARSARWEAATGD